MGAEGQRDWGQSRTGRGGLPLCPSAPNSFSPIVVAGLLVSGLVHFALTPHHLQDSLVLGAGFLGVALLECAAAVVFALRPAPRLWPSTVGLIMFSLTMYAMSRAAELPFGHAPEAVAMIDLICKGAELLALGGLLACIHTTTRDWPRGRSPRLAPASRYAYLVALVTLGAVAALMVIHFGHRFGGDHEREANRPTRPALTPR